MEWPWPFYPAVPQPQKPSGDAGDPRGAGRSRTPGRSPETDGRQGPEQGRPSPRPPDHRLEELGQQTCPRRVAPVRGNPLLDAQGRGRRAFPSGRCPLLALESPGASELRGPGHALVRLRQGVGVGAEGPPRWAAEPTARSARTGGGRALSPLDLSQWGQTPPPGPLCRGGRDLSHPEKTLRLPHPGSFSWDRAVPRAQAQQRGAGGLRLWSGATSGGGGGCGPVPGRGPGGSAL